MKYGLFSYSTSNIGDEIQSIAAKQFLPSEAVTYFDRDNIDNTHISEKIKLIMNGWFTHKPQNWPPKNTLIEPLLISFHMANEWGSSVENLLTPESLDFYKKHGPVGCRDKNTEALLKEKGIDAYFSGCLTLTLNNRFKQRNNSVYIVDVDKKIIPYIPKNITENAKYKTHIVDSTRRDDSDYKFSLAQERLDEYAQAKLVITSRLHCVLPCLAFGTPVIFIHKNLDDPRFAGLLSYFHHYSVDKILSDEEMVDWDIDYNPKDISEIRNSLIKKCNNFIGIHPQHKEQDTNKNNNEIFLFIKGIGGMGNRLQAFCSGVVLSHIYNKKNIVDWKDSMYGDNNQNSFEDFFVSPLVEKSNSIETIYPNMRDGKLDISSENIFYHVGKEGANRKIYLPPVDAPIFQKHYVYRDYTFRYNEIMSFSNILPSDWPTNNIDLLRRFLLKKYLILTPYVQNEIDNFYNSNFEGKVIGVHIRYTDNLKYSNRRYSLKSYDKAIKKILQDNPECRIFLSTDNKKILKQYSKKYKNIITYNKFFPGVSGEAIHTSGEFFDKKKMGRDALVEMYLLSKCDYLVFFRGKSSFSGTAWLLADTEKTKLIDLAKDADKENDFKEGVSIIHASKNRTENLKKSLKTWLSHPEVSEIILVDWSCNIPLKIALKDFLYDKRIVIVRAKNQPYWALSKAFNLAADFATKDKILKLDADILLKKDFFQKHVLKESTFYRGNWKDARDDNEKHLNGVGFFYTNNFLEMGGYNEILTTWGYDDTDLYMRLEKNNITPINIHKETLHHIPHNDSMRFEYQKSSKDKIIENKRNVLLTQKYIWGKQKKQDYWKIIRIDANSFIVSEKIYYRVLNRIKYSIIQNIILKLSTQFMFFKNSKRIFKIHHMNVIINECILAILGCFNGPRYGLSKIISYKRRGYEIQHDICFIGGMKKLPERTTILLDGLKKNNIKITQIHTCYLKSRNALQVKSSKIPYSLNYHMKFWCNLLPRITFENVYTFFILLKNTKSIQTSKFILLSEYSNYIVFIVKIFAWFYQKPIIFDAHGSLYYQRIVGAGDYPENSVYAKILFHIDRACALYVDRYITLSVSYAQRLSADFGIQKEKFISTYFGYNEINKDIEQCNKNIDIIQISNNKLFHGISEIIQLTSILVRKKPNLKILLTKSTSYRYEIKKLGLEENIETTGWLEHEKRFRYLQTTKLVFGPMGVSKLNEIDFSTKMNEALAYGKVLITQNTPSARELLRDGFNAILIDMKDLEGSAQKIIDILENDSKRKMIEEEAQRTYEKYLKPEIVVRELGEYIRDYS